MTMKLSEAILLGSTLSPQAFGSYETSDGRRCALGAALAAVGEDCFVGNAVARLGWIWPLLDRPVDCPQCGCSSRQELLGATIAHLNDAHGWTRERIAAWVEVDLELPCSQDVHADGGPGPGELMLEATAP